VVEWEDATRHPERRPNVRKYFTWRCLGLHTLVLVLVPAFLLAGWWQYGVARGGNGLSWLYTVEWPFFAVVAVYMWWALIHDRPTPFSRLWFAKQHAATDAAGFPLYDRPGWAMDKDLSRAVVAASLEAAQARELAISNGLPALESVDHPAQIASSIADHRGQGYLPVLEPDNGQPDDHLPDHGEMVIDAEVAEVTSSRDDDLDAYNRFLFDLSRRDPPKQWGPGRHPTSEGTDSSDARQSSPATPPATEPVRELPPTSS
jgi:hypothetical protein